MPNNYRGIIIEEFFKLILISHKKNSNSNVFDKHIGDLNSERYAVVFMNRR